MLCSRPPSLGPGDLWPYDCLVYSSGYISVYLHRHNPLGSISLSGLVNMVTPGPTRLATSCFLVTPVAQGSRWCPQYWVNSLSRLTRKQCNFHSLGVEWEHKGPGSEWPGVKASWA